MLTLFASEFHEQTISSNAHILASRFLPPSSPLRQTYSGTVWFYPIFFIVYLLLSLGISVENYYSWQLRYPGDVLTWWEDIRNRPLNIKHKVHVQHVMWYCMLQCVVYHICYRVCCTTYVTMCGIPHMLQGMLYHICYRVCCTTYVTMCGIPHMLQCLLYHICYNVCCTTYVTMYVVLHIQLLCIFVLEFI